MFFKKSSLLWYLVEVEVALLIPSQLLRSMQPHQPELAHMQLSNRVTYVVL